MNKLLDSFFRKLSEGKYEPTEATIGLWSPNFQHGGPPAALLTHSLRLYQPIGQFVISRITIEILGAIPVKPCEIKVEVVRNGKRIELLRGEYKSEGKIYMIAHAWRFISEQGVTNVILDTFEVPKLPEPQSPRPFPGVYYFPYGDALEWRFTKGGIDTLGPATVWAKPRIPLVENITTDPLEALVLMVDSANGISAELDIQKWSFVPVDLTIGVFRQPEGSWLGMEARTVIGHDGIGQTTAICFDGKGKVGQSIHTLFIRPR